MNRMLSMGLAIGFGMLTIDARAQAVNSLKFFADPSGTMCSLNYTKDGIVSTHVFITGGAPSHAIQFSAVTPACWTGGVWVGDDFPGPFLKDGHTQDPVDGLLIAFNQCYQMPFRVGSIYHHVVDLSASCCPYSPGPVDVCEGVECIRIIVTVDCTSPDEDDWVVREMQGVGLVVNANPSCPCDLPVAAVSSTWGRVKALYR